MLNYFSFLLKHEPSVYHSAHKFAYIKVLIDIFKLTYLLCVKI